MKELNKTGKVVQTDDKGTERFLFMMINLIRLLKKPLDPNKVKEKQEAKRKD